MKLKVISLTYFFVVLITAVCLYFVEGNLNLLLVGYFGDSANVVALLATALVPLFFTLFLFLFDHERKGILVLSSLLISAVYIMRISATIKNISNLNFQGTLSTSKFIFYCAIGIVMGAFAVTFIMFTLSDNVKSTATTLLKVSSILGIVIFTVFALSFFIAIFILSGERTMMRFFTVMSSVFFIDSFNCLLMLLSVGGLRKILYYRKSNKD